MRMRILTLFVMALAMNGGAFAQSGKVELIAGEVAHIFHRVYPGPHNVIFDRVLGRVGQPLNIKYLPFRRALRDFNARRADCLYVTADNPLDYPHGAVANGEIIFSSPITYLRLNAYTRAGEPVIEGFAGFKGKTVVGVPSQLALLQRYLVEPDATQYLSIDETERGFKLLRMRRVDVALSIDLDAEKTQTPAQFAQVSTAREFAIERQSEVLACWGRPATKSFINSFSDQIKLMRATGELRSIFSGSPPARTSADTQP